MILVGIILAVLFLLYVRWRVVYGYPPEDSPAVLCYHKLSDRFRFEGTWITPRRFVDQIDRLRDRGYRFIGEDEFYHLLDARSPANLRATEHPSAAEVSSASERSPAPERSLSSETSKTILLTFDDGYEEVYDVFMERLAPRGVPALVFLVTDYAGRENAWDLSLGRPSTRHLTWAQVEDMLKTGAAFGVHGATHADLTRVSPEALDTEVAGSRRTVRDRTGKSPRSFSFPFGRYDANVKAACERAGYDGAFSLYPRHANGTIDRFALRRNAVYLIDTNLTLRWKLERTPFFWFEEMKCRTIHSVAVITPMVKRVSPGPDR